MEINRVGIHPAPPRAGNLDVEEKHVKINALLSNVECCLVVAAPLQDVLSGACK